MKKTPMTMKKLMTKPKTQRVSRVVEVPPSIPEGFRTPADLFLEDYGIQIVEGEWTAGDCYEDIPVIDTAKLNSFEINLYYTKEDCPVTGIEYPGAMEDGSYCFVIYNPATVDGVNAAVYFEVLLTKSDAGCFFKRVGVEDNPDDSVPSEEGYRTLNQLFLDDFGIQVNGTMGADGLSEEQNLVLDTNKLDAFRDGLYYYLDADGYMQSPQRDEVTGEFLPAPEDWTGPFTNVWCDANPQEDGYYHFGISNPAREAGASDCLIKSEEGFLFKRVPQEDVAYRSLPQLFLEDFGIQLNKTEGEWESGEFCEKNTVADAALLDVWQEGLYFFCDADGNMQQPQQNSDMMLRKRGRAATQDPAWLGPFTAVCYNGLDEGGFHLFLIINSRSESSSCVPLIKSEEGFLFKRVPQEASELEPEQEPMPAPEPTPETTPEPEPAPFEPEPVPVSLPPPEPPAKSALEEVYGTLSSQKLCTIVGLRTLLAKEQGISIKEAKSQITAVFKAVSDIAALSGKSTLYGLGVFKQQKTAARTVRSNFSGTSYKLPRSSKFTFKPGKVLKAKMAMCMGKTTAGIITALQNLENVKKAKATVRKATTKGATVNKAIKKAGKKTGK